MEPHTDRPLVVHRFVTIEQVVRAQQPETADLKTLFSEWGLTRSAQEAFWVIAITEVARGGFHDVLVYSPNVLSAVLVAQTDRFYVAHNHPAGPVRPTDQDIQLTAQIMAAANAAGLSFEDHIITGPMGWFSFYDEGLLTRAAALGLRATRPQQTTTRRRAPPARPSPTQKLPGYALRYLPGNPSHWFAATGRGIRYLSLCGVDRRGKAYRPKAGPRIAGCDLCESASGRPIPGAIPRREHWSPRPVGRR